MTVAVPLHPATRIELHDLVTRRENDGHVVGRPANGEFVVLPELGRRALQLLGQHHDLGTVEQALNREYDEHVDLEDFVRQLLDLGFVRSIGGYAVTDQAGFEPSFRWLRAAHVRPLFGRTAHLLMAALVVAAVVCLVARPDLVPTPRMFFWTSCTSVVLLANAGLDYATMAVHELAHLAAARSVGVPARFGLGVRLLGIVVHTDLRGIWAVAPRQRRRVYLAGLAADAVVVSTAVLVAAAVGPPVRGALVALVLVRIIGMLWQCQIYTRTDMYCVMTDLVGARNLHEDASVHAIAQLRRVADRVSDRVGRQPSTRVDPLVGVGDREQVVIRRYALWMLAGSTVWLAAYCWFVIPIDIGVFVRGFHAVHDGSLVDGIITLALVGIPQVVLLYLIAVRGTRRVSRLRARLADSAPNMSDD